MNLFKTTFWNGIATVFKILTSIVTTKIIAVMLGPSGVAILGNFNNVSSIITSFSNGGISNGIVKYIAENDENTDEQNKIAANSIKLSIICGGIITILTVVFYKKITLVALKDIKYSYASLALACSILFYGLNLTISAILNGYRQIKYLVISNMIASTIMMVLAIVITSQFGLIGALINGMIAQVIIFAFNLYFIKKLKLINRELFRFRLDKNLVKRFIGFAIMAMVSAIVVPLTTLIIRNYIISKFSVNDAGYIQGIWSISNSYLMVITTTLSVYYLPTLARIKDEQSLRKEILKGYKFILPIAILGAITIFIFKDIIINILYTKEFLPMRDYFLFQNIGDAFKIASFLLGYLMIAKAMTRWYIVSEVFFSITRVLFSIMIMKSYGPIGETYSYALNYILHFIFMVILFRKLIFKGKNEIGED